MCECGEGQWNTQTAVTNIHFALATPRVKCNEMALGLDIGVLVHREILEVKITGQSSLSQDEQEGQHPLTGRRAANFRLLANHCAERRLVTQWRHGCRAMRRSVCNTGASNAGRYLCVQISMERSYPQPIYWYHSKGNWLRYNFATESFYIMKLFSRLFVLYCQIVQNTTNLGTLSPFWGS